MLVRRQHLEERDVGSEHIVCDRRDKADDLPGCRVYRQHDRAAVAQQAQVGFRRRRIRPADEEAV